jgi:hypothetical protein
VTHTEDLLLETTLGNNVDQSIEPGGTTHSLRWPVTAAIRSKSAS